MHLMNKHEIAEYLRAKPKTVDRWVREGKINCYKLLGRPLFDKERIDKALKAAVNG